MTARPTASRIAGALLAAAMLAALVPAAAQASPEDATETADSVIIRWRWGGFEEVELPAGASAEAAAARLAENPNVAYAEPNHPLETFADPGFDLQWGLHNTGQSIRTTTGTADVDVDAPQAWTSTKGSSEVIVAVIDSGIDITHPDLASRIWVNAAEKNGTAGVDDDGNGYVDDVNGWDFLNDDKTVYDDATGDVHATHIAGIIAAAEDGQGVVGVAPKVKIMPLKFSGADGMGGTYDAIEALRYAKANGARVVNASWGNSQYSTALYDAIRESGLAFVAAAGNSDTALDLDTNPIYPAAYDLPNVLSVTAINNRGRLASWANYGDETVDLAAPGVDIVSTVPDGNHGWMSGTSMAAPFGAGAAALVASTDTSASGADLVYAVRSSTKPLTALSSTTLTGGMVDAAGALGVDLRDGSVTSADGGDTTTADGSTSDGTTSDGTTPDDTTSDGTTEEPASEEACPSDQVVDADFLDVLDTSVHAESIDCVAWWGIANGVTGDEYDPTGKLSRAQMATFIARVLEAAGVELPAGADSFTDDDGNPHEANINALAELGVVNGTGPTTYAPNVAVNRAQMATYLVRTYEAISDASLPKGTDAFTDDDGNVHEAAINAAAAAEWASGVSADEYDPAGAVRRDQMASFLRRLLDTLVAEELAAPPTS